MSYDDGGDYGGRLSGYIDVATRIAEFRKLYPEGTLQPADPTVPYRIERVTGWENDGSKASPQWVERTRAYVVYVAAAYRTADDDRPGIGMAWEPYPGRTPYTRDSELQNAETSAWGRAIVAVGAADMHAGIATREEVRNRHESDAVPLPAMNPINAARERIARLAATRGIELTAISNSFREDQGVEIGQATLEQAEAYYTKLEALEGTEVP